MVKVKLKLIKDEDKKDFVKAVVDYNYYGMLSDAEAANIIKYIVQAKHLVDARIKLHEAIQIAYSREAYSEEVAKELAKETEPMLVAV